MSLVDVRRVNGGIRYLHRGQPVTGHVGLWHLADTDVDTKHVRR